MNAVVTRALDTLRPLTTSGTLSGKHQLPTPCEAYTVDELGAHLLEVMARGLQAGRHQTWTDPAESSTQGPWERFEKAAGALADVWTDPAAWAGKAEFYGQVHPARFAGNVMVMELLVHGWDLSRALGLPYTADDELIAIARATAEEIDNMGGRDLGAFATKAQPTADGPALDQLVAFTGRDPDWTA